MHVRRFLGRKALRAVVMRGARYDGGRISIRCRKGETSQHRVAIVCGKNVARRAVERNRIRRVLFDAVRLLLKDINEGPFDCALILRPGFSYQALMRRDIEAIVSNIRKVLSRV